MAEGWYTNDLRNIDKGRHRDETLERVTVGQRSISNQSMVLFGQSQTIREECLVCMSVQL